MADKPIGAYIELVEPITGPERLDAAVLPREVRINGQPLILSADDPITVHEMEFGALGEEFARVTVTLLARRVEIKQETRAETGEK